MDSISPGQACIYRKYRESLPHHVVQIVIDYLSEKHRGPLNQAVDLGCGSGQCTFQICKYFGHVLGTDISSTQIEEAVKQKEKQGVKNVTFDRKSSAEEIPLPDKSIELIIACRSAHWFDLDKLYSEGERVLCPGGVMTFIGTRTMSLTVEYIKDDGRNSELVKITDYIHDFLKPYFPPEAQASTDEYKEIKIPYNDFKRVGGVMDSKVVNLSFIIGLIQSYSMFHNFCRVEGTQEGEDFLENIRKKFLTATGLEGEDIDEDIFTLKTTYFILMGRLNGTN
ncbi:putative methyltransferase DDB_G0268948 isoform X2 [Folsomia candida]|uniref:putative methyltransferase DDB_G0268948 isoform X2 n=1 Tax=Folsomia candida TaxID=158441 RepID=UPI000B9094D7|nr:putative methyltransferase DDB_G0268948 isoform X2 [Folsomia candida]